MNYAQYFAIEKKLKNQGFEFERSELIQQFTSDKKSGLTELSAWEYKEFLKFLNTNFKLNNPDDQKEKCQVMRRKLIALFHKMNYKTEDGKADMPAINGWCEKYGKFHKKLNFHNYSELTEIITQAEKVYKSYIEYL
jgi:hypothetical protein